MKLKLTREVRLVHCLHRSSTAWLIEQMVARSVRLRLEPLPWTDGVLVLSSVKWDWSVTFPFFSTQDHLSRICALFNYFPYCLTHTQPIWAILLHLQCLCGFPSVHQSPISSLQAQTVRAPWVQRPQVEEQVPEFSLNAGLIIELSSDP